jgi:4-carboxymuconolactone decarboxylase
MHFFSDRHTVPVRKRATCDISVPEVSSMLRVLILCSAILMVGSASAQEKSKAPPKLDLRGDRFRGLTYDELTPPQKVITDRALAGRGPIGIFNITLRSPELSDAMRGIAGGRGALSTKQNELAILLTGRYWTTQFEFAVHHRAATQAGLSEATIGDIIAGKRPAALLPDEVPIYNFVTELLNTKQVSDITFNAAKQAVGEKGIVDVIGLSSFYQTVSLMMNVDRYPLTATQRAELQPLSKPLPFTPGGSKDAPAQPKSAGALRGDRFKPLTPEEMTAPQKNLMDLVISGKLEGGTNGPLNVLLRSPELGEGILRYGAYERFHTSLPAKLNELAALVTIFEWKSQFLWSQHHRAGLQAGLSEAVIHRIATFYRPTGLQPDEQAVYNFCAELLETKQMSDATFNAAKQQLGERGVVELMGVIGYYQTVSMLLNTDRYPLPDGVAPELTEYLRGELVR